MRDRTKTVIIKDDLITPYEVHIDEYNYSLVTPSYLDKDGRMHYKKFGHFNSMGRALDRVVRLRTISNLDQTTIDGYVKEYRRIKDSLVKMYDL